MLRPLALASARMHAALAGAHDTGYRRDTPVSGGDGPLAATTADRPDETNSRPAGRAIYPATSPNAYRRMSTTCSGSRATACAARSTSFSA